MNGIKYNYDQEADVLYLSFGRSEHVIGVELGDHLVLRLDPGQLMAQPPRAVGLTVLFPSQLLARGHVPSFNLERLERLPGNVREAVLNVLSKPPISELFSVKLTMPAEELRMPELVAA